MFIRFGRDRMQSLREEIGNPRREAAEARSREETRAHQETHQAKGRRAAEKQAANKAAREARRPICTGCGAKFTDERWEAAQARNWGGLKDSHPDLCDDCKQKASAAISPAADTQERQEPVRGEAEPNDSRAPQRPVCTECGAAFADERWKATARLGWSRSPAKRPSLCEDCDRRFESDLEQTWGVSHRQEEQDQAVPEQKAGGT
ncbi:hypothetical protein [Streptomyces sp. NPDC091416]|uniref:hypothetical protein n=1 Tax=Streptomyces sp. NPDC091416 TaxID=3366003 RepID=UPI00380C3D40